MEAGVGLPIVSKMFCVNIEIKVWNVIDNW